MPSVFSGSKLLLTGFSRPTMKRNGAHGEGPAVYATQHPSDHPVSAFSGCGAPFSNTTANLGIRSVWQAEPTVLLTTGLMGCLSPTRCLDGPHAVSPKEAGARSDRTSQDYLINRLFFVYGPVQQRMEEISTNGLKMVGSCGRVQTG